VNFYRNLTLLNVLLLMNTLTLKLSNEETHDEHTVLTAGIMVKLTLS